MFRPLFAQNKLRDIEDHVPWTERPSNVEDPTNVSAIQLVSCDSPIWKYLPTFLSYSPTLIRLLNKNVGIYKTALSNYKLKLSFVLPVGVTVAGVDVCLQNTHMKRRMKSSAQLSRCLITETGSSSWKPRGMTLARGWVRILGFAFRGDFWLRRSRKRGSTRDLDIRIHCHRHVTSNQPPLCQRL